MNLLFAVKKEKRYHKNIACQRKNLSISNERNFGVQKIFIFGIGLSVKIFFLATQL